MRGKREHCKRQQLRCRITPAGAGKTGSNVEGQRFYQDHPRRCGENQRRLAVYCDSTGSPPQVRGKPIYRNGVYTYFRITPAGAGKTQITLLILSSKQDHPRRCGENSALSAVLSAVAGSPPQVRGKLDSLSRNHVQTRITPAGAGKTSAITQLPRIYRDHPRRCGENDVRLRKFDPVPGSPPQVRGKRRTPRGQSAQAGITPAGAGKTCLSGRGRRVN